MEERKGHPLLRGGNLSVKLQNYRHGFSSSQIQSLTAVCEALIPSIHHHDGQDKSKALHSYYISSASHPPFPDQVVLYSLRPSLNLIFFLF